MGKNSTSKGKPKPAPETPSAPPAENPGSQIPDTADRQQQ